MPAAQYQLLESAELTADHSKSKSILVRRVLPIVAVLAIIGVVVVAVVTHGFKSSSSSSSSSASSSSFQSFGGTNGDHSYEHRYGHYCNKFSCSFNDVDMGDTLKAEHHEKIAHDDGTHSELTYSMERSKNFVGVDLEKHVHRVVCDKDSMYLVYTNAQTAADAGPRFSVGTFLSIGRMWKCVGGDHIRKISGNVKIVGNQIAFDTVQAALTDFVKHADVKLTHHAKPEAQPKKNADGERKRRTWESDLSSFMCKAGSYIDDVVTAAKDIENLVENGAFSYSGQPWSKEISLPTPNCAGLTQGLEGSTTCSSTLTISTQLNIVISDYTLKTFDASVSGPVTFDFNADSVGVSDSWSTSKQAKLWSDSFSSAFIVAGVPVPLELFVSVVGGFDIDVSAGLHVSGSFSASADVTLGFNYDGSGVSYVHDLSVHAQQPSVSFDAQVQGSLTLHLMPVLYLQAAYLGGPTAQPVITTVLDASYNNQASCSGLQASVEAGVSVSVGAKLDVDLPGDSIDHWWKSPTLYNTGLQQYGQWCINSW